MESPVPVENPVDNLSPVSVENPVDNFYDVESRIVQMAGLANCLKFRHWCTSSLGHNMLWIDRTAYAVS